MRAVSLNQNCEASLMRVRLCCL